MLSIMQGISLLNNGALLNQYEGTVVIGTKRYYTTPLSISETILGTVIPNVTANTITQKVTNVADIEFSSDTGFWAKQVGTSINGGVCHIGANFAFYKFNLLTIGHTYRIIIEILATHGTTGIYFPFIGNDERINGAGFHEIIVTATAMHFYCYNEGAETIDVDNILILDVTGWCALEIPAYCNYANDAVNYVDYGKLYNFYAIKKIQDDIDTYNNANPTNKHKCRVIDYDDYTNITNALNSSVGGGKMKEIGTEHWDSPNTGADNSTGLTLLGGGFRYGADGLFYDIKKTGIYWLNSIVDDFKSKAFSAIYNAASLAESIQPKLQAFSSFYAYYNSRGLILGDSTISASYGQNGIDYYLLTDSERQKGNDIYNIANSGDTIQNQKDKYLINIRKGTYDYVFIQLGINNLSFTTIEADWVALLQDLIDTVAAGEPAHCKIVVCTMVPYRSAMVDNYGASNGEICYQKWISVNEAVKGNGLIPITGVDGVAYEHTPLLDDGLGNLLEIYQVDHVHPNNAGRQIIANSWKQVLNGFNIL